MKSSFHSLIPFLPFLLSYSANCQLRRLSKFYISEKESRVTLRVAVYRQSVCHGDKSLQTHEQYFFFNWTLAVKSLRNIRSDETMGLPLTTAAGPRQRSHSQVLVPQDSWPYFTVVVGWDTILQAATSRVRFPIRWTSSIYLILPAAIRPWVRLSL
jgi:hypothetical protein